MEIGSTPNEPMKDRYRLFLRRKSVYYAFDNTTKTFESLKTKDKAEATRLLLALNEAGKQPAMNLGLARVYLRLQHFKWYTIGGACVCPYFPHSN